jgi:hypothetical protein
LVKALLDVSKRRQFGLPCWCDTAAGTYCVGQPECEAANAAIKGAYDFSSRPAPIAASNAADKPRIRLLTMNILKHTIHIAIYDLCQEIEKLPASEQQTKIVTMASALHNNADKLVDALRDAISCCRDDDKTTVLTEERLEAWKHAAEVDDAKDGEA